MRIEYPRALLAAFAFVVLVALLVAGSTSGAAFGAYNPAWDGTAEFRSLADETDTDQEIIRNASAYRTTDPNGTLAVILSPESAYDGPDRSAVSQFVRAGGTVLVADDFGPNANRLLRDVGAEARFDGTPLRDERKYENGPALPIATTAGNHSYTSGVDSLVLNHGTAIDVNGTNGTAADVNATDATVLAHSSSYAYLDGNRNEELDDDETIASRPVVTVEQVGEGQVVAVSDPSVFINVMAERGDNSRLARNLHDGHDRIALDVSHAGSVPPVRAATLALRDSPLLQLVVGGTILALLVARGGLVPTDVFRRRSGRSESSSPRPDRETVVRGVQDRHPEWDADRVERVTQAIMTRETEGGTDE